MSNPAVISARSQPWRTVLESARSPRHRPRASSMIDLPAPVSPVMTVMPPLNSISRLETMV